jgi:hypothetical protein
MEKRTIERRLRSAICRILEGQERLVRQRKKIRQLARCGRDITRGLRLLGTLEATQELYLAHRDRLVKALGDDGLDVMLRSSAVSSSHLSKLVPRTSCRPGCQPILHVPQGVDRLGASTAHVHEGTAPRPVLRHLQQPSLSPQR